MAVGSSNIVEGSELPSRGVQPALVAACAASLALGLAFIFVRAPHPWGWTGIDHYDDLGRRLARGEPYGTLERMWGYPIVLAIGDRAFGGRIWPVLVGQAVLNALVPAMIYGEVRARLGPSIAAISALLIGALSLNTMYASTQAADALCTVATVAGIAVFARAERRGGGRLRCGAAGLLLGVAAQLRPNVLLLPLALGGVAAARRRLPVPAIATLVACALLLDVPWIVRNFAASGRFIPATTHGGIQLWYGSVQVPPYYGDWTDNPSAVFEASFLDYARDDRGDLTIDAPRSSCPGVGIDTALIEYRLNDSMTFTAAAPARADREGVRFVIPRPPLGSTLYYYFDVTWRTAAGERVTQPTPLARADGPLVHFIADDDLHDLDRRGDLMDGYDVARIIRHLAWGEPLPFADRLDLDGDGQVTARDLDAALTTLTQPSRVLQQVAAPAAILRGVRRDDIAATAELRDGSNIVVPRQWSGAITDLRIIGPLAADAMRSRRSFANLRAADALARRYPAADACFQVRPVVDGDFPRREPRADDRYRRLAWAEIARTPVAFAAASLRRVFDLFVISGPNDAPDRPALGSASRRMYATGRILTGGMFALFVVGCWTAWRRRLALDPFWVPIAYVPVTICYLLANMRYTVTVQPFEFVFAAIAIDALRLRLAASSARSPVAADGPRR
jgi:hypothetical protein